VNAPKSDFRGLSTKRLFTITEEEVPEWQYQREKYPRPDVTRDVRLYGSLTHLHCVSVLTAVNLLHLTEFARIADIIRA